MRSVIIRRASQDEQKNQNTKNYDIQNFMSIIKKKLTYKPKRASDKTETQQNNLYFTTKDMRSINRETR